MNGLQVKKENKVTPVVSVVIPSYNSSVYIRQCLEGIRAQDTKLAFEVIVVDSSDDGTDQIIITEFPEVRLFHFTERRPVGTGRNHGVKQARGEVVLFLDTDCLAKRTWIEEMYTAFKEFEADGICGSFENGTPWNIPGSVGFYLEFFRFLAYNGRPHPTPFLLGGNSGFKREIILSTGYNDVSVGDDFVLSWQLAKQGKILLFLPHVSVRHMNKTGLRNVLGYQYKLGLGACLYRAKTSSTFIPLLYRFPILIFLFPAGVLSWIGWTVLTKRGILEFIKFIALLPILYLANNVWAMGFFGNCVKGISCETNNRIRGLFTYQKNS